jgi:ubiquinone/menaquinone biosynthesis C-methylase UbiE
VHRSAPEGVKAETLEEEVAMPAALSDPVKQQVTAHWDKRAAGFDSDFGHSIATAAERAAWDRILDLVLPAGPLDALDIGCGTGFLSLELAARGHRVTGVDLATQMLAEARRKAGALGRTIAFKEADAENTALPAASFDLVISRHVLWTLPHPEEAINEWQRVLRPGGRLVVIDGAQYDHDVAPPPRENARASTEYADITDKLPFFGGRPREDIETLLRARNLTGLGADPLLDLIAAQGARAQAEGRTIRRRQRYVVWGNMPK